MAIFVAVILVALAFWVLYQFSGPLPGPIVKMLYVALVVLWLLSSWVLLSGSMGMVSIH